MMPLLYHGSCESMSQLNDDSMRLIVTSPPYWGAQRDSLFAGAAPQTTQSGQASTIPDYNEYFAWLKRCFRECYRVLKPGRLCAVQIGTTLINKQMMPIPFHFVGLMENIGFTFHQDILWHRWRGYDRRAGNTIRHPYPGYYLPNRDVEYVLVFRKPGGKRLFEAPSPALRESSRLFIDDLFIRHITSNLWHIATVQPGTFPHPCPSPEELFYRLITLYSFKGENILDPFLGTGTTAKVARLTERIPYGYEANPAFLSLARKRVWETQIKRQRWLIRFDKLPDAAATAKAA